MLFLRPAPNPYEPPRRDPKQLSADALKRQRAILRAWRRDSERRGRYAEEEEAIKELRDRGALFVVSHSGGKDSQATMIAVRKLVPDKQIIVVHAPLRHVEWEGSAQAAKNETPKGRPFLLAEKYDNVGEEVWLLERVVSKGRWPDQARRWCTSEWKSGPIPREVGQYADKHGHNIIVEAWGIRAEESPRRALQPPLKEHDRHGVTSMKTGEVREWYIWAPIKWQTTDEVFAAIKKAGLKPLWTYQQGMTRASCAFCILASKPDLQIAARMAPDLYALYVAVEHYIGERNRVEWERWGPRRTGWGGKKGKKRPKKPDPDHQATRREHGVPAGGVCGAGGGPGPGAPALRGDA